MEFLKKLFKPKQEIVYVEQTREVVRLTSEEYRKLEKSISKTAIDHGTTQLEAGFKLGVEHALRTIREGFTVGV